MSAFTRFRDSVLKPAAGYIVGGPAGASVVAGVEEAKLQAKSGSNNVSYSPGIPQGANDLNRISFVTVPTAPTGDSKINNTLFGNPLAVGLLFGFATLFFMSLGKK
ncbi:hypothetical protein GOV14_03505 [Candidatus Pacearchaeota archaeon]|nr:hypothetical protein [Candidatus Pacearchaeota archaeon]